MRYVAATIIVLVWAAVHVQGLEIRVRPEKAPVGGSDMSGGVVLIQETGIKTRLSSDGTCRPETDGTTGRLTIAVYVPGFMPVETKCSVGDSVELFLPLQTFRSEPIMLDLGTEAARVVTARQISDEAAAEAAVAPPPESTEGPALEPALGFNPLVVIEMIVGESIPEILGLGD